jgi:hypothetical protein
MSARKIIAALCAGGMLITPALAQEPQERAATEAELDLAKRLEGRVAGEPVDCIQNYRVNRTEIFDETAIVWHVGDTLYVNRPKNGADSLDERDILVTRTFGSQICNIDTIQLLDSSGFFSGIVFLDDFVPYRRPGDDG